MSGRKTSDNPAVFIRAALSQDTGGPWVGARAQVVTKIRDERQGIQSWQELADRLNIHLSTLDKLRANFPAVFE